MNLQLYLNTYLFDACKTVMLTNTPGSHSCGWTVIFNHGEKTWSTEQITTVLNFIQVHLSGKARLEPYEVKSGGGRFCRVFRIRKNAATQRNKSPHQGVLTRSDLNKLNEFIHRENHENVEINQVACITSKGEVVALTRPSRHNDVIFKMVSYYDESAPVTGEQGFVTTKGVYLNREQAYRLAIDHYLTLPKDYH